MKKPAPAAEETPVKPQTKARGEDKKPANKVAAESKVVRQSTEKKSGKKDSHS